VKDALPSQKKIDIEASTEALFNFAQKELKLLDLTTTVYKIKKGIEVGDASSAIDGALGEFTQSN